MWWVFAEWSLQVWRKSQEFGHWLESVACDGVVLKGKSGCRTKSADVHSLLPQQFFFFLDEIVVFFDKFPDFVISGLCASVKLLAKVVVFAGGSKGSNTRRRFWQFGMFSFLYFASWMCKLQGSLSIGLISTDLLRWLALFDWYVQWPVLKLGWFRHKGSLYLPQF